MQTGSADDDYQRRILPDVSRTFALTIPQLPGALRAPVTNAYLLCRIADTIEDEPTIAPEETQRYLDRFKEIVAGRAAAEPLVDELAGRLSDQTLPAERDLVAHIAGVIRVTAQFNDAQRAAILRCVERMCYGMPRFQSSASLHGLARSSDLDDYCYYVAGVVGEMLTELFCDYSPAIARHGEALRSRAVSFAQGLQMTNILKDVWEDRSRGACWLPREVFDRHGVDLSELRAAPPMPGFADGLHELVGVAHAHLRNALDYTLLMPRRETGIRRFCLWAVGLAALTLRNIDRNPGFTAGSEVKVSHTAVAMTRLCSDLAVRSNSTLRGLFAFAARGLPLGELPATIGAPAPDANLTAAEDAQRHRYGRSGA